jgi:uncharacterized protein
MEFLQTWLLAFWGILVESGVWLLAGFGIAGALHVLVPRSLLVKALGGKGVWPIVRGALIGAPLPLCSCSVIPTAAGLRRSGASRGASASFAVASPEISVPAVALTWGMLGPWFALTRPIVAIGIAIATGLALAGDKTSSKTSRSPETGPLPSPVTGTPIVAASCCSSGGAAQVLPDAGPDIGRTVSLSVLNTPTPPPPARTTGSWLSRLVEMVRFGYVTLPRSLAVWMLVGLGIAALVTALLPTGWAIGEGLPGGLVVQALAALVVGLPLYVCATTSTPLAVAMILAGVEPGAAMVFLIAGPATNPATVAWVTKDFGLRSAGVYVGVIAAGAMLAGLLLNPMLSEHVRLVTQAAAHEHAASGLKGALAGLLFALLILATLDSIWTKLSTRASARKAESCCSTEAVSHA